MSRRTPFITVSDPLKSPCIRNCCLNEDDVCVGCGRSLDEIRQWAAASVEQRKEILAEAKRRLESDPLKNRW